LSWWHGNRIPFHPLGQRHGIRNDAANPELIQTQVASLLVQPLEAASVVLASGVRIFDTNGPLRIPKLVSGAAVGFVAESAQIPEGGCPKFRGTSAAVR
jgi:hypothetical protein